MAENMRRILIIEDDKNTANLVATYLQKEGYFALVENDGINGLKAAREEQPALVILDLMLPGIDGLEICRGCGMNQIFRS